MMLGALLDTPLVWVVVAISAVMFAGSLVLIPWLLVRLPEDFLVRPPGPPLESLRQRPALWIMAVVAKNAAGLALLVLGVVMLVTPGQGLLAIVTGIMLLDVPGKRHLEKKLLLEPHVLHFVNRMRIRHGRPPLHT